MIFRLISGTQAHNLVTSGWKMLSEIFSITLFLFCKSSVRNHCAAQEDTIIILQDKQFAKGKGKGKGKLNLARVAHSVTRLISRGALDLAIFPFGLQRIFFLQETQVRVSMQSGQQLFCQLGYYVTMTPSLLLLLLVAV